MTRNAEILRTLQGRPVAPRKSHILRKLPGSPWVLVGFRYHIGLWVDGEEVETWPWAKRSSAIAQWEAVIHY